MSVCIRKISTLIICSYYFQRVISFQSSFLYRTPLCQSKSIQHTTFPKCVLRFSSYDNIHNSIDDDEDDDEDDEEPSSNTLGINIGSIMDPLTPQQAAELRAEARQEINKAFQGRLDEIQQIKKQLQQDFEKSRKASEEASNQRAEEETQRLLQKIDAISQDFLKENQQGRSDLKLASRADQAMEGKGVEYGSWGNLRGMDVVMKASDASFSKSPNQLLGSVGAVTKSSSPSWDRRILILSDDKQVSYI